MYQYFFNKTVLAFAQAEPRLINFQSVVSLVKEVMLRLIDLKGGLTSLWLIAHSFFRLILFHFLPY